MARGLVAGLLYRDLGLGFEEAYAVLADVPPEELMDVQRGWDGGGGGGTRTHIVHGSKRLTVLDTTIEANSAPAISAEYGVQSVSVAATTAAVSNAFDDQIETEAGTVRSLHFNRQVDLVQSCARVSAVTGHVVHDTLPPAGCFGTTVQGMGLAFAVRAVAVRRVGGRIPTSQFTARRVVVLGAGACTLPAYLYTAFPGITVDAVERSAEVLAVARQQFRMADLEAASGGRFRLHGACAYAWTRANSSALAGQVDILIADLQDGDAVGGLVAPQADILAPEMLQALKAMLAPCGVMAVNTIGTGGAIAQVAARMRATEACLPPTHGEARRSIATTEGASVQVSHSILFYRNDGSGEKVSADDILRELHSLPPLVDDPPAWLAAWEQLPPKQGEVNEIL